MVMEFRIVITTMVMDFRIVITTMHGNGVPHCHNNYGNGVLHCHSSFAGDKPVIPLGDVSLTKFGLLIIVIVI